MAKIAVTCSACGARFAVKASAAGRKALCSRCGAEVNIPTVAPPAKTGGLGFALIVGGLVVLIAIGAGAFFLFVYEAPEQPASDDPFAAKPEDIVAPSASRPPREDEPAPQTSGTSDEAMVVVADAIDAMTQGNVDAALEHYAQPVPAEARRAIDERVQRIADGKLELKALEAAARGRWAMAVVRVVETGVVDIRKSLTEQWLIRRDGKWRMVHEAAFNEADIMMAMDSSFDALAGWFNSNVDALRDEYIDQAVVERELAGVERVDPQALRDEPMAQADASSQQQTEQSEPEDDKPAADKDALRDISEEAFAAANDGDYDKANELLDVSAVAGDDVQAWWDEKTADRSLISRATRTRRITENDDGSLHVMIRSRKNDGTVFTITVDVKFEDGKWVVVQDAS